MELNEKVQIVKNAILNNPVLKDFKEYEHNLKYYKIIKENIDYLYNFWKNKSENEREKINNIYLEIKKVANQKYYNSELDYKKVLQYLDEEFNNSIWDKIITRIYSIFENTNAFNNVWMAKVSIVKWFIWNKKWKIESWNNIIDYFKFIEWIVNDKKIIIFPFWVSNIAKEVLWLYNLSSYNNYINNWIVKTFLWFLFNESINDTNELLLYLKYKDIFKSEIETLFSIIDLSKYGIRLSNDEEYNFKLNLIADRLIFELNNNSSDNLEKLNSLIWIENESINNITVSPMIKNTSKILDTKKQIILFWPPWTGKTYSIKDVIEKHSNEWKTYEQLKKEWRVEFITFHQSFSYEEFIEWIKPELDWDSEDIKYKIEEGIFKKISNKFIDNIYSNSLVANWVIDSSKNFYKLSLWEYWINDDVYDYCISNNCISLWYGKDFDYTNIYNKVKDNFFNNKTVDQFKNIIKKEKIEWITPFDIQAIEYFIEFMKKWDYVFISKWNFKLRAIWKIVWDYEYSNDSWIEYKHFRKVEWLLKNVDIDVKDFFDRKFSQMSIYSLEKNRLNFDIINSYLSTNSIVSIDESTKKELLKNFYKKTCDERKELLLNQKKYYLVIDEINRWNISKIFGELITLLESDKRLWEGNELTTKLPYSKEEFWIPPNLYLVATMNTSDKSIVSLDTALRRRFWFVEMIPNYNLLKEKGATFDWISVSDLLRKLNQRIEYLLDKDHLIWHSYFLKIESIEDLKSVFYNEIIPLLEEYFYWEEEKIKLVIWDDFFEENKIDYKKLFGKTNDDFDNWKNILKLKNIDNLWIDAFKKILNQVNNTQWNTENQ